EVAVYASTAIHEAAHAVVAEVHRGGRVAEVVVNEDGSGLTRLEQRGAAQVGQDNSAEVERLKAHYAAMDLAERIARVCDMLRGQFTDEEVRLQLLFRMV